MIRYLFQADPFEMLHHGYIVDGANVIFFKFFLSIFLCLFLCEISFSVCDYLRFCVICNMYISYFIFTCMPTLGVPRSECRCHCSDRSVQRQGPGMAAVCTEVPAWPALLQEGEQKRKIM